MPCLDGQCHHQQFSEDQGCEGNCHNVDKFRLKKQKCTIHNYAAWNERKWKELQHQPKWQLLLTIYNVHGWIESNFSKWFLNYSEIIKSFENCRDTQKGFFVWQYNARTCTSGKQLNSFLLRLAITTESCKSDCAVPFPPSYSSVNEGATSECYFLF